MNRAALLLAAAVLVSPIASAADDPPQWVGAIVCKSCHGPGQDNDPFTIWSVSKHSRTWVQLGTGYVQMIDPEAKGLVPEGFGGSILREANRLGIDQDCFVCHTTARNDPALRAETFHVEDGVQCEACHGASGEHVRWMEANGPGERPQASRMDVPDRRTFCTDACHRAKPTHEPFIDTAFDVDKAWPKIAH